jgi:transposase
MYVRTVRVPSSNGGINEYVRVVEAYRENGKVKQRVIADLGRKDVLVAMLPKLRRVLEGNPQLQDEPDEGQPDIIECFTWGPVLVVRHLFEQLGLWEIFDRLLGAGKEVEWADRALVLIAARLMHPCSEHGLAGWLEREYFCDRRGRRFVPRWHQRNRVRVHHQQLDAWYRTLDKLLGAKAEIEVALYGQLRDLFSIKPDLVLYDITSTYFEGGGPPGLGRYGHSRDEKRGNVQVLVGVVMVGGWPIVHHVWEGNRLDNSTVAEVIEDLERRFEFERVVFVGDRGMVSEKNLQRLREEGHGYLVGIKRRRNPFARRCLSGIDEGKWIDCSGGINAQEKKRPPRTRVQEVGSGEEGVRVFVMDSDERREYEQRMRAGSMERVREKLEGVQRRVEEGKLTEAAQIGAAAERAMQAHHGGRYYRWKVEGGRFIFEENPQGLEDEKRVEGRYVISTTEQDLEPLEAVRMYKELSDVEQGFRSLKDVLQMRPIYHQIAPRVKAHIFVAALGLLLMRMLQRQLTDAKVNLSASDAIRALSSVQVARFKLENQSARQGVSRGSPQARQVLKALGIVDTKPPACPQTATTVT